MKSRNALLEKKIFEREGLTWCALLSKAELETVVRSSRETDAKLMEGLAFIKLKYYEVNVYPVKL